MFFYESEKQEACKSFFPPPASEEVLVDSKSVVETRGVDVGQGMTEPL